MGSFNIVLAQKADEKEAFQSKIFALLQSDKFDEVLKQVNNNKDFGKGMVFERAYSYYRLKQFQKALDEINTQTTLSQQLLHLRSQIVRAFHCVKHNCGVRRSRESNLTDVAR
jgi:hypothetical protein